MENPMPFAMRIHTNLPFAAAVQRSRELLADEGFGILSEIDIDQTLKAKLGLDMAPCKILGACNPPFAHQAMEIEPLVSVLLPCNVVVRELGNCREIAVMNPAIMGALVPDLGPLGAAVGLRLSRMLERLEAESPRA